MKRLLLVGLLTLNVACLEPRQEDWVCVYKPGTDVPDKYRTIGMMSWHGDDAGGLTVNSVGGGTSYARGSWTRVCYCNEVKEAIRN